MAEVQASENINGDWMQCGDTTFVREGTFPFFNQNGKTWFVQEIVDSYETPK